MLVGDYTIKNINGNALGVGGQGSVYEGKNNKTGTKVAIKVIDLSNPSNRKAFESEYQVLCARSKSIKNVVDIPGTFQKDQLGFIIMKQYDCDLFSFAFEESDSLLPEIVAKEIFRKICIGVKNLHREGIAHLDIKPENILMDRNTMGPYICDFGNAFTSTATKRQRSNSINVPALGYRGTKRYSSPEMDLTPYFYDPFKSDIYSLGITLYILLVGSYPSKNLDGSINLDGIKDKSKDCINLLHSLLNCNPDERDSIERIIKHPYLGTPKKIFLPRFSRKLKRSL